MTPARGGLGGRAGALLLIPPGGMVETPRNHPKHGFFCAASWLVEGAQCWPVPSASPFLKDRLSLSVREKM